jgi:hypothetical protein
MTPFLKCGERRFQKAGMKVGRFCRQVLGILELEMIMVSCIVFYQPTLRLLVGKYITTAKLGRKPP